MLWYARSADREVGRAGDSKGGRLGAGGTLVSFNRVHALSVTFALDRRITTYMPIRSSADGRVQSGDMINVVAASRRRPQKAWEFSWDDWDGVPDAATERVSESAAEKQETVSPSVSPAEAKEPAAPADVKKSRSTKGARPSGRKISVDKKALDSVEIPEADKAQPLPKAEGKPTDPATKRRSRAKPAPAPVPEPVTEAPKTENRVATPSRRRPPKAWEFEWPGDVGESPALSEVDVEPAAQEIASKKSEEDGRNKDRPRTTSAKTAHPKADVKRARPQKRTAPQGAVSAAREKADLFEESGTDQLPFKQADQPVKDEAIALDQAEAAREQRDREEQARLARREEERLKREEARRVAREEAAAKRREKAEQAKLAREALARERREKEEQARLAREEEEERLKREEEERLAKEAAEREQREREEQAQREREEAERREQEAAAAKAKEEFERWRRAAEQARKEREERKAKEAERLAQEEAARRAEETAALERKRREAAQREQATKVEEPQPVRLLVQRETVAVPKTGREKRVQTVEVVRKRRVSVADPLFATPRPKLTLNAFKASSPTFPPVEAAPPPPAISAESQPNPAVDTETIRRTHGNDRLVTAAVNISDMLSNIETQPDLRDRIKDAMNDLRRAIASVEITLIKQGFG